MKLIFFLCVLVCIPVSVYSYTDVISDETYISSNPPFGTDVLIDDGVIHVSGTVHIQGTPGHPIFISMNELGERKCRINVSGSRTRLYLSNVYFKGLDTAICVRGNAYVSLQDVWFEDVQQGVAIEIGTVIGERVYMDNIHEIAVQVPLYGSATFRNVDITNSHTGFINNGVLALHSVLMQNNKEGIINTGNLGVHGASFEKNDVALTSSRNVGITDTWWGTSSTQIQQGEIAGQKVSFTNQFLFARDTPYTRCCKNVLFFPGMQATRIVDGDNQLWEPHTEDDVRALFMNEDSLDRTGVVSDVIDEVNILPIFRSNIYKNILGTLDIWRRSLLIADYTAMPYDWRLPVDVIADQFIDQLQKTLIPGKRNVVLIGHSNGGLVIKSILRKLETQKENRENNYIDAIQQVIYVAVPHAGAPKALFSLIHGYDQGIPFILKPQVARQLAYALPGVYGLLPSAASITSTIGYSNKVSSFMETTDVDTPQEFESFIHSDTHVSSSSLNTSLPMKLSQKVYEKSVKLMNTTRGYVPTIKTTNIIGVGLPTPNAIEYMIRDIACIHGYPACMKGEYVSYSVYNTNTGDGTVLRSSAEQDAAQSVYVDLMAHNEEETEVGHADILESDTIVETIRHIIEDVPVQFIRNEYTVSQNHIFPDPIHYYSLRSFSPVEIHVYNEEGRHVGIQEQTEIYTIPETGIPNSEYYVYGDSEHIYIPKGAYSVRIKGTSDGWFSLTLTESVGRYGEPHTVWETGDVPVSWGEELSFDLSDTKPIFQGEMFMEPEILESQHHTRTRMCRYSKEQIQNIQRIIESISIFIDQDIYNRWRKLYPKLYKQAC